MKNVFFMSMKDTLQVRISISGAMGFIIDIELIKTANIVDSLIYLKYIHFNSIDLNKYNY